MLSLIVSLAACGSDSSASRFYDAEAAYDCMTNRPDYHPGDWYADQHNKHALSTAFYLSGSPRKQLAYDPYYIFKVGPVRRIAVLFYGHVQSATLLFFDDATRPALLKRWLLTRFPPRALSPGAGFPSVDPEFTVDRNVFIDTTPTPFPKAGTTRSIILGCLRRR